MRSILAIGLALPAVAPLMMAGLLAADTNELRRTPVQRMEPDVLKATHEAVQRFARERVALPDLGAREDFRAVIHVHAEDSNHTKGTRAEVLAAAKATGVRAVLFTDHRGPQTNTWHELRDGVLFLAGSEDGDGKLRFPNFGSNREPLPDGELRFITHVEERYDADPKGFAGMEIVNRHSDAILDQSAQEYLAAAARQPDQWQKVAELFKAYPDEMFAAGCDYRAEIMAKWDRETERQPFTGIAANDAHQNVQINGVTFDPYAVSFRNLCTHVLATNLTEPAIRAALREGHVYVSHDWLCDPTGFAFGAVNNLGVFSLGDSAPMQGATRIVGLTPLPARLKLFHLGQVIAQTNGTNLTFRAKKAGAYRLEAWLNVAGEERPWIYSNPVYLKEQSLLDTPWPNAAEAPNVEVKKDLVYADGKPDDEPKHKLDLYIPKETKHAPVFLFIHGGAWRFGDRGLYPPLGYRFAKEGILTVIPSYRLAPKNPWPAQAEDAAAALAWTVRHIAEFGGDTNRLFIGGHSAGGHISSLLALNPRYLQVHQLSASLLRGVIALSGVYNLDLGDVQTAVFGTDRTVRRDASPLFQIIKPAPPFLVTYCEWDYPTLPAQAKIFYAALRHAGVPADLFFTAHESHISEVLAMTHDTDPTGQAVVKFIRDHGR
ncbi:MAG TPA: alpha/beta hydrolase fold domain-containing protein [Verrucomicrobiae bacterium]|nr:alpha/beta hydrolase fold domain-containing protein [Verrucomicrobiae bacterium]